MQRSYPSTQSSTRQSTLNRGTLVIMETLENTSGGTSNASAADGKVEGRYSQLQHMPSSTHPDRRVVCLASRLLLYCLLAAGNDLTKHLR